MINKKNFSRLKVISILVSVLLGSSVSYYFAQPSSSVKDFDFNRDKNFIEQRFDSDWYWLTAFTREQTDPVKQFELHAVSLQDPASYGKLIIKVLYNKSEPAGFVAYYLKSFYEGVILFLDVDDKFRRQHLGERLLRYAFDDLYSKGVQVIRLVTRVDNLKAQGLYNRIGFKENHRDDKFVYFEKTSR